MMTRCLSSKWPLLGKVHFSAKLGTSFAELRFAHVSPGGWSTISSLIVEMETSGKATQILGSRKGLSDTASGAILRGRQAKWLGMLA